MSKKVGELDGQPCKAILCVYPGCLLGHVSKEMKTYCKIDSTICRRAQLLTHFNTTPNSRLNVVMYALVRMKVVICLIRR